MTTGCVLLLVNPVGVEVLWSFEDATPSVVVWQEFASINNLLLLYSDTATIQTSRDVDGC